MGISITPNLLFTKKAAQPDRKLGDIAKDGKYYRHPDSALISYPVVVENPLGSINKSLKVAIIGGGAAGIAALYELSNLNLKEPAKPICITLYESDPDHCLFVPDNYALRIKGLKAGRVSAAVSSDDPVPENTDRSVYEIGAMRFPEIAGLMWHYATVVYGTEKVVSPFPNPGTVPTELVHGDLVDRFAADQWLKDDSPTKKVVDLIRKRLVGSPTGDNTSLFLIGGKDPAKISAQLKSNETTEDELKNIQKEWKKFTMENDVTLESAVRKIIEKYEAELPIVAGLIEKVEKVNYYVELFGTVGFGTGGFKSVFNMSILETMRLMLWNYSNEYMLPVEANVDFLHNFYKKALAKNPNVQIKRARVSDAVHVDGNAGGAAMVVYYDIDENGTEGIEPQNEVYDYVILATTPKQVASMIHKVGFNNKDARRVPLGEHGRQLTPDKYQGAVRPAMVLSKNYDVPNSKLYSAVSNVHMVCSSKIFATVKKSEFDAYAPEFFDKGKIKAIVANCGVGSSYVVPYTILNERMRLKSLDYYSFLISYAWEDDSKGLQHNFGKYPLNVYSTKRMMDAVIGRTIRYVNDPVDGVYKSWWFGEALSNCKLEDPLSYDWTTFQSAGAFKLNNVGENYNCDLLFRYHTHALTPALKNRFFLAGCSYSHLGGWIEGAFMSAVNAVCGLVVAANDGNITALSTEAQKVLASLDNVVEDE